MAKFSLFFVCVSLACLGSSQSASFECNFMTDSWGTLGMIYYCQVQNSVSITTLDEAEVDSISGAHKAGYKNDNVEAFSIQKGQIHYFPRGLNRFLKNLKGIEIYSTKLKDIHGSDLKPFPKLANLYLYSNDLEILEENLFEFNPDLDYIYFRSNKISHIDPNVFDKLTKLKSLYLSSNTCININAERNPTQLQNVIKTAKLQCTNSDYSKLEQKVKNLEAESKNLNSKKLTEKLEILESEIKRSKFSNFFQESLQDLKAAQVQKAQDEALTTTTTTTTESIKSETCSALEPKIDEITANLKDLMTHATNRTECATLNENFGNLSENFSKLRQDFTSFDENFSELVLKMDQNMSGLKEVILNSQREMSTLVKDATAENSKSKPNERIEKFEIKLEVLEENLSNFKSFSYKKFDKIAIEEKVVHASLKMALGVSIEENEKKIGEIEVKIDRKFEEIEKKFQEKLEKILKVVKNME